MEEWSSIESKVIRIRISLGSRGDCPEGQSDNKYATKMNECEVYQALGVDHRGNNKEMKQSWLQLMCCTLISYHSVCCKNGGWFALE